MRIPAGVNKSGICEKLAVTERNTNKFDSSGEPTAIKPRGMVTIKIAFSWTCHPNMKEHMVQITKQGISLALEGRCQRENRAG